MFNLDIDINVLISQCFQFLELFYEEIMSLVSEQTINLDGTHYMHLASVGNKNTCLRRSIARKSNMLPSSYTIFLIVFPHHKGKKLVSFICYLSSLGNIKKDKILQGESNSITHRSKQKKKLKGYN